MQTMADFKSRVRQSADPRKTNTKSMGDFARMLTDEETKAAAEYFASIKWTPWIKVVETSDVPRTRIVGGMFMALEGNEREPIGDRVNEVPQNTDATELLRDPHSGFVAYVPIGSIKKGEELVVRGGVRTTACGVCHGTDLHGVGPVPGIAGRSPSYLVRQMYDMQQGARHGIWADLMKPVVERLNAEDMRAIAAYVASRP
jgi:cytochrome c553